ncbi:MAG TPA: lipoyl(octanoyl) transferase LipB [Candidatus Dormibacteraeota bacterium]
MSSLRARWLGSVSYRDAWTLQRELAQQRRDGQIGDELLLLEHPPVYTMGRGGDPRHLGAGPEALRAAGAEYVDVDRGGSVTFHGPGQLVAYPIVWLPGVFPIAGHPAHGDVVRYVRALEGAAIRVAAAFEVGAGRRPPYTGVWLGTAKLAAIGVKVARGVTLHGLALNVCTDLSWFERVTPCGIAGASATSLQALGVRGATPETVAPLLAAELAAAFGRDLVPDAVTAPASTAPAAA